MNGKRADETEVRHALERLLADGVRSEVRVTEAADDAERFAREAVEAGVEQVVVFGGDGTLSQVAAGLVAATGPEGRAFRGAVGVIPGGTANDFATCAGIPADDPAAAVAALAGYRPATLDIGWSAWGDTRPFINVATAGFGAEATAEVSEDLKAILGRVAYLVAGLANVGEAARREVTITAPGFERRLAFYVLAVGNARCAGGVPVCPDADPADGLFDVTIVPRGAAGAAAAEVVGKGLEGVGDAGLRFRAPWVEIHADEPLQVNLDGEPASGTRFRFEVKPRALRVLLPEDSPLLSPSGVSPEPPPSDRIGAEPTGE